MNSHLKCPFCHDFLIFHLQIESKFLGVIRNSGRYGYENYYTVKLGGNPHTIQLFDWNPKATFQLKRKGLYNLTMTTETEPTLAIENMRWVNCKDEAT
jgi:hypothetical protein